VQRLQALPSAGVLFNYLGQFDQSLARSDMMSLSAMSAGAERSPQAQRSHLLQVTSYVSGGRLHVEWTYSQTLHHWQTIQHLAQSYLEALRTLIIHCRNRDALTHKADAFPQAHLSQEELDAILAELAE
jgi:non-ribosomal peptide synthase protein (TIGR01720 family)